VGVTVTVMRELVAIKCSGWEADMCLGGFDREMEVVTHCEIIGKSTKQSSIVFVRWSCRIACEETTVVLETDLVITSVLSEFACFHVTYGSLTI